MLTDTLLHKTNATTLSASQMVQRFSSGVTFSSRVYEDCSIYSADDREGNTRMILHNRSPRDISISMKALNLKHIGKAVLFASDSCRFHEHISEVEIDKDFTVIVPAESVTLLLVPLQ